MALDNAGPRTRRALLGAGLGAIAATVASSLAGRGTAEAASYVVLGGSNSGNDTTITAAGNGSGISLHSDGGNGVEGYSNTGSGIYAYSADGSGVLARSGAANVAAIVGDSDANGTGVQGISGIASPNPPAKTGVYGVASQDATSIGVYGRSQVGTGVYGTSPDGKGVYADSARDSAVYGLSDATGAAAVVGRSQGGNTGVLGYSGGGSPPASTAKTGVYGYAAAVGVRATATNGRGVVASGNIAQLRLVPASGSHPASGQAGDLFMDHADKLWLCKGGSSWHQLA